MNVKQITIAIDYDGTYTADPLLWLDFIQKALDKGHKVVCVTMRWEGESDSMDPRLKNLVPVVFTARQAKHPYVKKQGIDVHIWIDDCPHFVYEDSM